MARLRRNEGIALPVTIALLAIVILLVGVAVSYSVHSLNRSTYDRGSARALAAADAGLDIAGYRMNKTLVGGEVTNLAGFLNHSVLTLGCLDVNVLGLVSLGSGGWCAAAPTAEAVDGEGGLSGEQFEYYSQLSLLNLSGALTGILSRKVVSVGKADGRTARVMGTYTVDLAKVTALDSLLSLFTLKKYVQCPAGSFSPSNPDQGCPT